MTSWEERGLRAIIYLLNVRGVSESILCLKLEKHPSLSFSALNTNIP